MGVPKFFRYMSERYPCLSELVREYQIPEFDNMYLDMNGIIHMCSHPDDNDPHFRITEEKIFQDVFHYIDVLFRMIRPQKLFFMAIDGVAPRAKMNQQRGRRFRAAKDAEKQEREAKKRGELLPTEARFDSNCITPGTVFMARLHEQLKYFCVEKISNDPLWTNVKIVLSGHETPGEGEHKIMDYIRYLRSEPGYDPNTRHCLYGLDADLIMLGLCTHEPHFSLLREEVKFGKKSTKRQSVPEEITFFLLHLSLMREYLELEFAPVKDKLVGFEYDFEKIIDDWVLMGFLVGNDFIPHLPNLHIANGALPILYNAYMEVLPTLDGYINEAGTLNLARFEKFMQRLADFDLENFDEVRDDLIYMESKTGRKFNPHSKVSTDYDLEKWQPEEGNDKNDDNVFSALEPEGNTIARDSGLEVLIQATEELDVTSDEEDEEDDDEEQAFKDYKKDYYMNKLEYSKVTPEVLRGQAEGYVRAIQWNLNYYYNGVCSWSWYYPHHYAPYISDIKGFSNLKIEFELGTPFKPYEQLLGVLPEGSKALLPKAYHHLMTAEESPISKYYPVEFQTDLNGKRQDWEAVVLIPFMDEKLLLKAMEACNENLSDEEKRRNTHGPMLIYTHTKQDLGVYNNPLDCFPAVTHNHSLVTPVSIEDIRVPKEKLIKGPHPGAAMDVYYPGFPTFKHLEYKGRLKKAKVKVFEQPSRYESMIIQLALNRSVNDDIPVELIGAEVFVGWPHLIEGRILAMSNRGTKYVSMGSDNQYNSENIEDKTVFPRQASEVSERYKTRLGIEIGDVTVVCHVQVMVGRKYVFSPNGRLTMEKQFSEMTTNYPLQTIVRNIKVHDPQMALFRDIQDVFPEGSVCFTLSNPYYGCQGIVLDSRDTKVTGRIKVCVGSTNEPDFDDAKIMKTEILRSYKTLSHSSNQLGMGQLMYSRITGSIFVVAPNGEGGFKHINVGLDLKMNKKNKETPGYTKKIGSIWYYTNKCTALVREYSDKFPEVFRFFSTNEVADQVNIEDIFENWEERLKELQQWLKNVPTHGLKRLPCGSYITEPEVIQKIEEIVDEYLKNVTSKKITMTIKPAFLYKPEIQTGTLPPDPKMEVRLFDRIINVRKGFSVPFGLKGTVVAISQPESRNERDVMYDVVFDKPFKDGLQLDCSAGRGYKLPQTAFIDLTYGQRVLEEKTGKGESVKDLLERAQKPNKLPWQVQNGQKFFNQSTRDQPPQRTIPDTYPYPNRSTQEVEEASAFASFNSKNKMIARGAPDEMEKKENRGSSDRSYRTKSTEGKSSSVPLKKAQPFQTDNLFPSFASPEASRKSESVINKQEKPARVTSDNTCVVDTMLLKSLLKITGDNKTSSSSNISVSSASKNNDSVSNLSFSELIKNIDNTPPSTRLLTYYQSNNMGLPRYNYFSSGDKFKAQLMLNTGEIVIGDAAPTKEEATDRVALKVLDLLLKKPLPLVENTLPPKVWVDTAKGKSKGAPKPVIPSQFIPTQVIKRQSSVGSAANASQSASNNPSSKVQEKSNEDVGKDAKKVEKSSKVVKKKRTRIAANFSNK